jgi:hypothetical protein
MLDRYLGRDYIRAELYRVGARSTEYWIPFEDRLPQPLPEGTRVSHKIGYYGTTYADAGVVFPEGAHDATEAYLMVVIASDTSELASRAAMQEMSLAAYSILTESAQTSAQGSKEQGS